MFTKKKGQIEMSETVIAVFIFLVIFIIVFGFYYSQFTSSIKASAYKEKDTENLLLISAVMGSAEFYCSNNNVVENGCLDVTKINNFVVLMDNDGFANFYKNVFRNSRISVQQVYPKELDEIVFYEVGESSERFVRNVPILLYYPSLKEYNIGMLKVEVFK